MKSISDRLYKLVYSQAQSRSIVRTGHKDWSLIYDQVQDQVQDQVRQARNQVWHKVQ